MVRMRSHQIPVRVAWGAMFALLLAIRSLAPAGFMPAFDHGAVAIVACPDAAGSSPMPMDGAGHRNAAHQQCPYAAVSSPAALGTGWAPLVAVELFAVVLLPGCTLILPERHRIRERPPVRGPPLPA